MNLNDLDRMSPHLPSNAQQDRLVFVGSLLAMIMGAVALVTLAIGNVFKAAAIVACVLFIILFVPYLLKHRGAIVGALPPLVMAAVFIVFSVVSK